MAQHTIFVYGTLKKQHSNHSLLVHSKHLGTGRTIDKYGLYVSSIPFVIKQETISHIYGELYSVDDYTLAQIDMLEGHPDWYQREKVKISTDNDQVITAWLYFYPEKIGKPVPSGCYELR